MRYVEDYSPISQPTYPKSEGWEHQHQPCMWPDLCHACLISWEKSPLSKIEGWEQIGDDEVVVKDWALNAICAYAAFTTALLIIMLGAIFL